MEGEIVKGIEGEKEGRCARQKKNRACKCHLCVTRYRVGGKEGNGEEGNRRGGGVSNGAVGFEQGTGKGWGFAAIYEEPTFQVRGSLFT
jgi:hypothetical protein